MGKLESSGGGEGRDYVCHPPPTEGPPRLLPGPGGVRSAAVDVRVQMGQLVRDENIFFVNPEGGPGLEITTVEATSPNDQHHLTIAHHGRLMSETTEANAYRAHIQKKFIRMWSRDAFTEIPGCFDQTLTSEEHESLEEYFTPRVPRRPHTVVLKALQRMGKTRFLMKVMLAWSDGTLYRDKFSFIFYLCCRELKQLRVTSLARLICREWPDDSVPLADIVAQPERILFIVDSLEELLCTLMEPESELCRDWREERSVKTVLSSLLRRKILPESALLLAAIPRRPEALESKLDHPNMQDLRSFQASHVKQYFCCSFGDRGRAMAAFSWVQSNEHLFTMCHVPLLCWMMCTSLKQEMERGRDLAATCCRSSSVFLSFMFQAFIPKGATRPSQQGQGLLKALCSLAAEGMWTDTWVFGEEELRRNGIADTDTTTLLDLRLFRKYSESGSSYCFIHMCMQEFCAAMYYLLDSSRDHPSRAVRPIDALLLTYFRKDRASWVFLGCFLFGLVYGSEQQRLDALLGMQRSRELAPQLLGCLRSLVEIKEPEEQVEFLLLFYALFEMQSDAFASHLMSSLREAHFPLRERPDLAVAAYCLKYCYSLRELTVSVPEIFPEERGPNPMSSRTLLWWRQICCVLTTNEHLQKLLVVESKLSRWTLLILCCQLRQTTCPVQRLETRKVSFFCETGIFFEVFTSNPNLQHLSMTSTQLSHDEVWVLCSTLCNPVCNLQELLLQDSGLSAPDCKALASMLEINRKLTLLDLSDNKLAEGVPTLCAALYHPYCTLKTLVMAGCQICEHFCPHFSEVLLRNTNLSHLDLSSNPLMDKGVAQLCEALRQPTCRLQTLWEVGEVSPDPLGNVSVNLVVQAAGSLDAIVEEQEMRSPSCSGVSQCAQLNIVSIAKPQRCREQERSKEAGGTDSRKGQKSASGGAWDNRSLCWLLPYSLQRCGITLKICRVLALVLESNPNLRSLDVGGNNIGDIGMAFLSGGVLHPHCGLQELSLDSCQLTRACCEDLASVIAHSQTLHELDVTGNALSPRGVMLLCEAARGPRCVLRKLRRTSKVGSWSPEHGIRVSNLRDTAVELGLQGPRPCSVEQDPQGRP
uniref:NACHT, LRR and PYD domains-containing protein 4 n=1 Tax=Ictidomys tridecemlineatus TaxID=43179 RepID=UPI001A9E8B47|nr:NACHT, LRR and PYD domains-containing protein 4 [Ictidomys tridecemlineatus]